MGDGKIAGERSDRESVLSGFNAPVPAVYANPSEDPNSIIAKTATQKDVRLLWDSGVFDNIACTQGGNLSVSRITERYTILGTLGEGGMGMVYRAQDSVIDREVALKTIRDTPSQVALDLFRKECSVLAAMSHPNIVEIFDIGDFEEGGVLKPYFVMPLLRGETLAQLIRNSSQRLTLERSLEIILQACRGLHAAHERGLVHRDLKPNNIFVMPDDSVKIIDFGVAHMADLHATMTVKGGTLLYMAPEQIESKPASPSSDIFGLGVVGYEMLTGRRPFGFSTEQEIIEAILHYIPPPASEVNPSIPAIYSRIIHKAMAKQPWNRFPSAKELAETIQKAQRNEPIEMFDASRLAPRVQRAAKAFEQGNLEFASEILRELEAAGEVDTSLSDLRRRLDAATRQKTLAQLLESARTCMEGEEFLLALQKTQEVLQLDPQNVTALGMRNAIEVRRNENKVEEWLNLARRHLENSAFSHAREALDNILKISPTDATAYQLMAEVDRREDQHIQASQQKDKLYQGALSAWKSGELSSALSKLERLVDLDRRVPDGGDSARSISFQNFYNEVRSEQDLIRSAYQEARAHLGDGHYATALEICQKYLAKYPEHALFQALKFDVEEKERQALSSHVAEVDRQVEAEPDLDRRVNLLRAALEQNPGEPHFERALRSARDKRDLVNGIVTKARAYEEQGQFSESLGQLEILNTIHKEFPGLEFEIERLQKRRQQQTLSEAKTRWVEQIDRHLESADYPRAMDLIAKAMAEFPGDPEMAALGTLARQSQTRAAEAQESLKKGQDLCAAGQYEEGIEALRHAWKLDANNLAVRTSLLQTLTQRARGLLDTDWPAARRIIDEALEVDSAHTPARSVRTLTEDREREENVATLTAECRRMQSEGRIQAALAMVEEGLQKYPKEMRLSQLWATLKKAMPAAVQTERSSAVPPAPPAVEGIATPAAQASAAAAGAVSSTPVAKSQPVEPPAREPAPAFGATMIIGAVRSQATPPRSASAAYAPLPPSAPPVPAAVAPSNPPKVSGVAHAVPRWVRPAAAVSMLAIVGFAITRSRPITVDFRTEPSGATLRIDGTVRGQSNLRLTLRPGAYRVEVSKSGYTTVARNLDLRRGSASVLTIALQPAASAPVIPLPAPGGLRISTDLAAGELQVDDNSPVRLQDGQLSLDRLPDGIHTFKVRSGRAEASVSLKAAQGMQAQLTGPIAAKDLQAIIVTGVGNHARVYSSSQLPMSVDGRAVGNVGASGTDLNDLSEGDHELSFNAGQQIWKLQVHSGPAAMVWFSLTSDRDVGSVLVVTGENGVHVVVDGKEQKRLTQGGQLQVGNLSVRDHVIKVFKDGFQDELPAQVAVKKGEEARLQFRLRARPTQASLSVRGAVAGTEVRIDGALVGTVQPDGSLSYDAVSEGEHEIELRARRYKSKQIRAQFRSGNPFVIAGAEAALERSTGTLQFNIIPANATVTYARGGEKPQQPAGPGVELEEGTYTITASAPGFSEQSQTIQVLAGKTETAALRLTAQVVAPTVLTMDTWTKGGWTREGVWYAHRGGEFVVFPVSPISGTIVFTALRRTHLLANNRIRWVVQYRDQRNYLLFELDKKNLYRSEIVDGKRRELPKASVTIPLADNNLQYTLRIDISGTKIEHFIQSGNQWLSLDTLSFAGNLASRGGFGFYLPGNDELLISDFTYTKKQ